VRRRALDAIPGSPEHKGGCDQHNGGHGADRQIDPGSRKRRELLLPGSGLITFCGGIERNPKYANRSLDVTQILPAEIVEPERNCVREEVPDALRNTDAAGFRERLQTRRNINAVSEQVHVVVNDHIAHGKADAEQEPPLVSKVQIFTTVDRLEIDSAARGIYRTVEFGENRIAGRVENPAFMFPDKPDEGLSSLAKSANGFILRDRHQAAIAGDIGGKNYRQLAFQFLGCIFHVDGQDSGLAALGIT